MPLIERLAWDSTVFRLEAGRVARAESVPGVDECRAFDHVSVKVPQENLGLAWRYEQLGFRFVTIDYLLEWSGTPAAAYPRARAAIRRVAKQPPDFQVSGFSMAGSRLALDPALAVRMPVDFWDAMIANHCRDFADFCLCALDGKRRLEGFLSCLETKEAVNLFLVVVHPSATGRGIGSSLIAEAALAAREKGRKLTTNVVSQNLAAMKFYARQGFHPVGGDIVLHYRNERFR